MPITHQPNIRYPVSLLEVGDSFFVPALHAGAPMHKVRAIADELGFTVEYRTGIDTATGIYGIRVYRTA